MLQYWNLFDLEGTARSPPPSHGLAVLVAQTSDDLDTNGQVYTSDQKPSNTGSCAPLAACPLLKQERPKRHRLVLRPCWWLQDCH